MKLSSLYVFGGMLPVPGTQRREMQFHAADGWQMERLEDGRIRCERIEEVDGGTAARRFVLERVPVAYVEHVEPAAPCVDCKVPVADGALRCTECFLNHATRGIEAFGDPTPGPVSSDDYVFRAPAAEPPRRRGRPRKA